MFATTETHQNFRAAIARFLAVGLATMLAVLISAGVLMALGQRQTNWIVHTYQVQREITSIRLSVTQLIGVRLGNRLHAKHGRDQQAAPIKATLDRSIDQLAHLTDDNPRQQARVPLLLASVAQVEGQAGLDVPVDTRNAALSDDPGERVTALCATMLDEEIQLMNSRMKQRADLARALYVILGLTALLLLIVAVLAYTTIRSYTREISASRAALHAANEGWRRQCRSARRT